MTDFCPPSSDKESHLLHPKPGHPSKKNVFLYQNSALNLMESITKLDSIARNSEFQFLGENDTGNFSFSEKTTLECKNINF